MKRNIKLFYCNGVKPRANTSKYKILEYRPGMESRNIIVGLPKFALSLLHIPDRTLDLLEIAAYIFSGDRFTTRGKRDSVEFQSWSRSFEYHIKVRDYKFWNQMAVKKALANALLFMTGDADYSFSFYPGHSTSPAGLFDLDGFSMAVESPPPSVALFSGGLDSLSGAIDLLENTKGKVILVSHQSQHGTTHTQKQLTTSLENSYPKRVFHYQFRCTLKGGTRAPEETQRSRSFLYLSLGYAIASTLKQNEINVYENGVTGFNFYRREDLVLARASRTTHPQTLKKMELFLSMLEGQPFKINTPYLTMTKQDVLKRMKTSPHPSLISSSVSCSQTFKRKRSATHCGECFQCIDRRIASHGAGVENWDHIGLYSHDVFIHNIDSSESKTTVIDYIRQAVKLSSWNIDLFYEEFLGEIQEITEYAFDDLNEYQKVNLIWNLVYKHSREVLDALQKIQGKYDDLRVKFPRESLLSLISAREYLKPEVEQLAENITNIVQSAIGEMFHNERPKNEPDLNSKIGALLRSHGIKLKSEFPSASFAGANVVPDHTLVDSDLVIELKYLRGNTTPSKATEGMSSDLTKYPSDKFILFLVYDPDHAIKVDEDFKKDFELKGRCLVRILR